MILSFVCRSVMLDRAETVLHDHYAGKDYWDVCKIVIITILVIVINH